MDFDPLALSRFQFAFVVMFHIIFPAFTIGLASYLAFLKGLHLATRNPAYDRLFAFWKKIFAVSFGLGVVSGVVMAYQFGTNWSGLIERAGGVLGPLLAYEVLTAFFLEAVFLGIMLFGQGRVSPLVHFAATCAVAFGTVLSMFWIIAANSWLQTPAGHFIDELGRIRAEDWMAVIFNPSTVVRFLHMSLAAYLTTAFVVAGVSAWGLLKSRDEGENRRAFAMAMGFIMLVAPAQMIVGHWQGENMAHHQPAKLAAVEGAWETRTNAPLLLFAWPDADAETNHAAVGIPGLASFLTHGSFDAELTGLKDVPEADRPPVLPVFWAFRIMVGLGVLMFATALAGVALLARKRLFSNKPFQQWCVLMAPSGWIAVATGWMTTEIGRQPWIVHGLVRTEEAVSPITGEEVLSSLLAFMIVYAAIFGAGVYFLIKIVAKGVGGDGHRDGGAARPKRPWSAAEEAIDATAAPAQ